jgi:hypothetical protein
MTPDQLKQIADCVTLIRNMRHGGQQDSAIRGALLVDGWDVVAVNAAFKEVDDLDETILPVAEFKGRWDPRDPEPWETFQICLLAIGEGDFVIDPPDVHQVLELSGYRLVLEKIDKSETPASDLFAKEPPNWARDSFNGGYGEQCGDCGAWCEVVRPGKTQCRNPDCEVDG